MPASDVYSWAKQPHKPSYTASEVGAASASHSHSYLPLAGGTVSGNVYFTPVGEKATAAGIFWAGSTDGAGIYYETRGADSGHLVLNMTDDSNVTVDIAASGAVKSYFGYDGTFHGNVSGNASSASSIPWSGITGKPSTYAPSSHTHDDRYYTESEMNAKLNAKANSSHTHTKAQITDFPTSMPASDVYAWAKAASKPSYTIGEVSGNLAASRISGTISAANLPSYVDDVLEYASLSKFPTKGESGKIYTALDTNKIYRWSGSAYVVISETVALGTTHSSAGYGDESRAAYNHSTKTSGNPHHVTKTDVGLGNVDNTADSAKSVKYATTAGSANTEYSVQVSSTQPTDSRCKIWIKI